QPGPPSRGLGALGWVSRQLPAGWHFSANYRRLATARAQATPAISAADRSRAPTLSQAAADLVSAARPFAALARDERSLSHSGIGGDAAADASRSRAAEVSRMARQVPLARHARARARRGRRPHVVSARLQHPPTTPAIDCPRSGRALRRQAAVRR